MRNFKKFTYLVLTFFLFTPAVYASLETAKLDQILASAGLDRQQLGMLIEDENGPVFMINAERQFVPASLTKIITAGAALEMLETKYSFHTQLYADSAVTNGVVKGSIYLKGGGDPSFNSRKLTFLLKQLSKHKVKKVEGDLIIDDSRFDDPRVDNWTTVKSLIHSWSVHGYPLFVQLDPPKEYSPVVRVWKKAERGLRAMLVSKQRDFVVYKNMTEPDLWTGFRLVRLMRDNRITFQGKVKRGRVPEDARLIAELTSPLPSVVKQMMKNSDNYMAEVLTKNLAAEAGAQPVTIEAGIDLLKTYMDHVGIDRQNYVMQSAAGYSQLNSISADTICKVLKYLDGSSVAAAFRASLPVAGVDGTLRYRMRRTPARGRVYAKTGSLYGAVGLAGYISRPDGRLLTFALIYNGKAPSKARDAFDRICVEVVQP